MQRYLPILVLAAACGETQSAQINQINLDRPIDVAFACAGGLRLTNGAPAAVEQLIAETATTTYSCDWRALHAHLPDDIGGGDNGLEPDGKPDIPYPPGQEILTDADGLIISQTGDQFWYAFVLQQGPGTVAVATFSTDAPEEVKGFRVLDTDTITPGKNSISVGEDPIAIATDKAGCHEVIANAGTCDLSDLEINSALYSTRPIVRRVDVTNGAGQRIGARPAAMIAEPATTAVGFSCPVDAAGASIASGLVYIAYPGCHLVAGVDAATGVIQKAIQYDAAGVPTIVDGATLTCPDECGFELPTEGTRPMTIDLADDTRVGTRRMVIGADNSPTITIVELDPVTSLPLSLSQLPLENTTGGDLGVTDVSLSLQVGMGGSTGLNDAIANGGQFQFVYAVTTDRTVRVADVLTLNKECDTQVDPRFLRGTTSVKTLSCLPVGDPTTPPRRFAARSPGIHLPNDGVPVAVGINRSALVTNGTNAADQEGYFAMIAATNGTSFIVNIDDDRQTDSFSSAAPFTTAVPLVIAHQLRDVGLDRAYEPERLFDVDNDGKEELAPVCDDFNPTNSDNIALGGPHATSNPQVTASSAFISPDRTFELPTLRQVRCIGQEVDRADKTRVVAENTFVAPTNVRDEVFPDFSAFLADQTWTVTYEGSLSNSKIDSDLGVQQVLDGEMRVDTGGIHMIDKGKQFCAAGVEPFDILQMRGCDPAAGDDQCPKGYTCFIHPESQISGIGECMLADEAERLATACKPYLTSLRRYTVRQASSGELQLLPRRVELRTSPLNGCTDDAQCQTLADYALRLTNAQHPNADTTGPDPHTWTCSADANRAPVTTGKRCELRCDADADCSVGSVCQGQGAGPKSGFCMEGVFPPQSCVNGPHRFELRAGNAFAVVGSRSGFIHPIIADSNGQCIKDPNASVLARGRIPLVAPPCDPTADPITGKRGDGTFDPNPCSVMATTTEVQPPYIDVANGNCAVRTGDDLKANPAPIVDVATPSMRFRNPGMTLTMVDLTYPGDAKCLFDRAGTLQNVPLVFPGYQLLFRTVGGLQPLTPSPFVMPVAVPVAIVRGPSQSFWVVDQGDVLSTQIGQPSTRGRVFRVESFNTGLVNRLE
jgi:hypothetical protein